MGYQALLFCPDEKTARTVTQVLSELDFSVTPCTEPFGAVKKLMAEHFDAVVVDCDNEQNATLLFKSARNAANNQSALAVAVVEGQAGVAKAFRIGANLVLTKPINVEQAKGTLRVARGLLRKNETSKPISAAGDAPKPAPTPQAVVKSPQRSQVASIPADRPVAPVVPYTPAASLPLQKAATQPSAVAFTPVTATEADTDVIEPISVIESKTKAKVEAATSQPPLAQATPKAGVSPKSSGASAASAPAPAREAKPAAIPGEGSSAPVAALGIVTEKSEAAASETRPAVASEFTFGGNAGTEPKSGSGSKKALLWCAAVVVILAGCYGAWMQFGHSLPSASAPARVAAQPVTATPTAAPKPTSSSSTPASSATVQSNPDSSVAKQTVASSSDTQPLTSAAKTPVRSSKDSAGIEPSKASAAAASVAANKPSQPKESAQPIVIKSNVAKPAGAAVVASNDAPAPSITDIASATSAAAMPDLGSSSTAAPVLQRLNVSQGVSRGLLVKEVQPIYPPSALRARIEGPVQLLATLSKNGDITAVKTLNGDKQLAQAATTAVKQWKYKPYLLNGEPVEIQTQITVNFKLPR
jgi:TonB family protein